MTERLMFPGGAGAELAGVLHRPDGQVKGSVLLAHCFTCSKDLHTTVRFARGLSAAGYAVLRFDFTGIGDSGGDFTAKTVTNNVRDLTAAATALIRQGLGPCALVGHSLGGSAVLLAAHRLKTVRSVAVVGAPSSPDHVRRLLLEAEQTIHDEGTATVEIAGRTFPLPVGFLDDLATHDQAGLIAALGRPLLVVHAVDDEVVDVAEGERIFSIARQPKAFMPLLDADHLVTDRAAAGRALTILTGWLDQTL